MEKQGPQPSQQVMEIDINHDTVEVMLLGRGGAWYVIAEISADLATMPRCYRVPLLLKVECSHKSQCHATAPDGS